MGSKFFESAPNDIVPNTMNQNVITCCRRRLDDSTQTWHMPQVRRRINLHVCSGRSMRLRIANSGRFQPSDLQTGAHRAALTPVRSQPQRRCVSCERRLAFQPHASWGRRPSGCSMTSRRRCWRTCARTAGATTAGSSRSGEACRSLSKCFLFLLSSTMCCVHHGCL